MKVGCISAPRLIALKDSDGGGEGSICSREDIAGTHTLG